MKPSKEYLNSIFQNAGINLSPHQLDSFWAFHCLLRKQNKALDLTRLFNFENMVIKHYVDCALIPKLMRLPSELLDLGTGAGFPGIPIKIMAPELKLTLMETRESRVMFLEEAVTHLGLKDVSIKKKKLLGDIGRGYPAIITRAFKKIPDTLEMLPRVLEPGGIVIFMKGPNCDEELEKAVTRFKGMYRLREDIPYNIPGTSHMRRLIVFERSRPTMKTRTIKSPQNPTFKELQGLLRSKGIERQKKALMWGEKIVKDVLRDHRDMVIGIITRMGGPYPEVQGLDIPCYELEPGLFRELDPFETHHPIAVVSLPGFKRFQGVLDKAGPYLLIPFQDPTNVGAVIRTAAAMGLKDILFLESAAHPFHPRSVRACGPYLFSLNLYEKIGIKEVSESGMELVGLAPPPLGKDIFEFSFPESFILVPGLEGTGLPPGLTLNHSVSIPMAEGVESLNAAMATGLALVLWRYKERSKVLQ